jgi:alkylhydroperoxidase family enzyme
MLDYALLLTRDPASVGPGDVDRLRELGYSDRAVLDVCQITAYYAYANRLADGLGVDLEEGWAEEELTVTRAEWAHARERRG